MNLQVLIRQALQREILQLRILQGLASPAWAGGGGQSKSGVTRWRSLLSKDAQSLSSGPFPTGSESLIDFAPLDCARGRQGRL